MYGHFRDMRYRNLSDVSLQPHLERGSARWAVDLEPGGGRRRAKAARHGRRTTARAERERTGPFPWEKLLKNPEALRAPLREGLNVQNAAKPEARHGASLQVQAMVQESSRPKEVCHEVCGGCGDWPDTTASAIRRAKYVTKNYRATRPPPCPMATPPFSPYFDVQPDKIVKD